MIQIAPTLVMHNTIGNNIHTVLCENKQTTDHLWGCMLTCDQAFFFQRSAKEKQRETQRSVGGQSGYSQARKKYLALQYFRVPPKKERLIAG